MELDTSNFSKGLALAGSKLKDAAYNFDRVFDSSASVLDKFSQVSLIIKNLGNSATSVGKAITENISLPSAEARIKTNDLSLSMSALAAKGIKTSEAITGVKVALSNIVKPSIEASKAIEDLGIKFNSLKPIMMNTGGNMISGLLEGMESDKTEVIEWISNLGESIKVKFEDVISIQLSSKTFGGFGKSIGQEFPKETSDGNKNAEEKEINNKDNNTVKKGKDNSTKLSDKFAKALGKESTTEVVAEYGPKIISSLAESISTNMPEVAASVNQVASYIQDAINKLPAPVSKLINESLGSIKENLSNRAIEWTANKIDSVLNSDIASKIFNVFNKTKGQEETSDKNKKASDKDKKSGEKSKEKEKNTKSKKAEEKTKGINSKNKKTEEKVKGTGGKEKDNDIDGKAKETAAKLSDKIAKALGKESISEVVSEYGKKIISGLSKSISTNMPGVTAAVSKISLNIKNAINKLPTPAVQLLNEALGSIKQKLSEQATQWATNKIEMMLNSKTLSNLTSKLKNHAQAVTASGTASKIASAATTLFSTAMTFLTSPIGLVAIGIAGLSVAGFLLYKNWGTIGPKLKGIWTDIKDSASKIFNGLVKDLEKIGGDIINGLIKGLQNNIDKVKKWIGNLGETIMSVFREKTEMHSPSRVFMRYGQFIGEGLVVGMSSMEQSIVQQSNKYSQLVIPKLSPVQAPKVTLGSSLNTKGTMNKLKDSILNFNPKINLYVTVADTGKKGTEKLTQEVKGMTATALKDGLIAMFMEDAVRD